MENEFIPKSKFSKCFDKLCKDYVFLAIVAFAISFINVKYYSNAAFILKIYINFVPALIYSIETKSIAKLRFVLAYTGVYVGLYFVKLCWVFFINYYDVPWAIVFFGSKMLIFAVYEFICSLAVFWLTNLIVYGILKLIAKSKRT